MDDMRGTVSLAVGAVLAVLLQMMLAPNIAVASALPNFAAAYVLVVAVVCPERTGPALAFALGLAFDLVGNGPVGAMALLLLLASFLASRAFLALDNDTLFIPLFILAVSLLVVELFYGGFLAHAGSSASLFEALVYRALPCALYDCVVGLAMYPLVARFVARSGQKPRKMLLR